MSAQSRVGYLPRRTTFGSSGFAPSRVSAVCGDAFVHTGGAMPSTQKIERVAELKEQIEGSTALLLTEYRGLTVAEITELRKSLGEGGARFAVIKNTLMRRALENTDAAGLGSLFEGPSAVAFVLERPRRSREERHGGREEVPGARAQGRVRGRTRAVRRRSEIARRPRVPRGDAVEDRRSDEGGDVARGLDVPGNTVAVPLAARSLQGEAARGEPSGTRGRRHRGRGGT